jgi:hypothetical protein
METKFVFGVLAAVALILLVSTAYAFPLGLFEEKESDTAGNPEPLINDVLDPTPGLGTMSTSGTAIIKVDPDRVEIELGIKVQKDNAAAAEQEVAKIMDAIRANLAETGVKYEIETGYYNMYPIYDYDHFSGTDYKIVGYEVTHTVVVKTSETGSVGKLIDAAAAAGANKVNSISFTLSDEKKDEITNLALAKAAKNAKAKADTIASALGLSVKKITKISESSYEPYIYRGYAMESVKSSASADYSTQVEPSEVSITATVSMEFEFG